VEEMVILLPLLMLKSRRKKISTVLKSTLFNRVLFINYKQSIFRQNTNQSNDSTFTRQVSRKTPTHVIIDCGGIGISCEHLLTYLFFAPNGDFIKLFTHLQIKKMHILYLDLLKSQKERF
jgi:hypothetical protein